MTVPCAAPRSPPWTRERLLPPNRGRAVSYGQIALLVQALRERGDEPLRYYAQVHAEVAPTIQPKSAAHPSAMKQQQQQQQQQRQQQQQQMEQQMEQMEGTIIKMKIHSSRRAWKA